MRVRALVATGPCLRRYTLDNGVPVPLGVPRHRVNGITIAPQHGKRVMLNVIGAGLLQRFEIIAGDAAATIPFKGGHIQLQKGPLHWVLKNGRLENVSLARRPVSSTGCGSPARPSTSSCPARASAGRAST